MRQTIEELVRTTLEALRRDGTLPETLFADGIGPRFIVERPKDKSHGDFSTNAALVLSKPARMNPRALAERILAALPPEQTDVERWEVAGPGFINFHLAPASLRRLIGVIQDEGAAFGRSGVGAGRKVQVEFVSANPTGPMHLGHGRGAVTGDVIARLLEATGFQVEREYYLNDAGTQMAVLGRSVLIRYRQSFGQELEMPEGCYPAAYVQEIAQSLRDRDGEAWLAAPLDGDPPEAVVDFAIEQVVGWIHSDLEHLDIHFDHWFSERTLHRRGGIERAVERLAADGLIYEGVLDPPKGKLPEDWESRPQTLFRSSRFGDEVDRPLKKSDGAYTYFAADIAYHYDKARRGFDQLINVWGADHGGYVKRVKAALEALTGKKELLEVELVQMVNLFRGGKPVRMSKRAGVFVTLREVIDEVGPDPVRFLFLTRSGNAQLDFDLELAASRSNDNPVFYVQYAHARVHSLRDKLAERELSAAGGDLARLESPAELDLLRLLGQFPEVVEGAALAREPHRIPYYLTELSAAFHTYYNSHRILDEDAALRGARLALVAVTGRVIANGLALLGVSAPGRM